MSLACHILASCLLIFFSSRGTEIKIFSGPLNENFSLPASCTLKSNAVEDITWQKDTNKIAQLKLVNSNWQQLSEERYRVFKNGTLEIKQLKQNDGGSYVLQIYDSKGKEICDQNYELKIEERVSKPAIILNCSRKSLICQVTNGTNTELKLSLDGTITHRDGNIIENNWQGNHDVSYQCTVSNNINNMTNEGKTLCFEKTLDLYFIIGVCAGGTILLVFVTLLVCYLSKRRKQNRKKDDEGIEVRVCRATSKERSQKPHQTPGPGPQNPAVSASQPPPPPSHRTHTPAQRPPPPGLRVPQQQQRRPLPSPGAQTYQQKGPPLPRPRVQPKPHRGPAENS